MRFILGRHARRVLVLSFGLIALAAGIAYATIPDSAGVIHGCYRNNGQLRVIDPSNGGACKNNETGLDWSQTGPQGPPGPRRHQRHQRREWLRARVGYGSVAGRRSWHRSDQQHLLPGWQEGDRWRHHRRLPARRAFRPVGYPRIRPSGQRKRLERVHPADG